MSRSSSPKREVGEAKKFGERVNARFEELRSFLEAARTRCEGLRTDVIAREHALGAAVEENANTHALQEELNLALAALRAGDENLEQARQAILAEMRRWRELFEAAPEPYALTDRQGNILDANRLLLTSLEFNGPILRKPLVNFVHRADTRKLRDAIARFAFEDHVGNLVLRLRPRGGSAVFPVLVSATSRHESDDAAGHIHWILHRINDVAAAAAHVT